MADAAEMARIALYLQSLQRKQEARPKRPARARGLIPQAEIEAQAEPDPSADWLKPKPAALLAAKVNSYWQRRGLAAGAYAARDGLVYVVRSTMLGGKPAATRAERGKFELLGDALDALWADREAA